MKFTFHRQLDALDCGAACLYMIADYYKKKVNIDYIRELCGINKQGVSLLAISEAAEQIGFKTIGGKITLEQLKSSSIFPCILHWNQNHFVVLFKIKKSFIKKEYIFYIADPAKGIIKYTETEFKKHWISTIHQQSEKGIVLILQDTGTNFNFIEKSNVSSKYIVKYILRYKKYFLQILLSFIIAGFIQLLFPYLTQAIVDIGIGTKNISFIYLVLIAQLTLTLSRILSDYLRQWLFLHVGTRLQLYLLSTYLIKLLKLPIKFFDTRQIGDLVQRIDDHQRIERFFTNYFVEFVYHILFFIIYLFILLSFDTNVFFIFIFFSILQTLWILLFLKKRRKIDFILFELNGKNNQTTYNLFLGIQEIKLQQCEKAKRWEWEDIQAETFYVYLKSLKLSQIQNLGITLLNEIKNILIVILTATFVTQDKITIGTMMAIQYIIGQLVLPIDQIIQFIQNIQDMKISMERIQQVQQHPSENESKIIPKNTFKDYSIYVNNLSFKYDGQYKFVLENIQLIIPEKKITAIVGPSGSGKTTLLKILLQFYNPQKGDIIIDGYSLKNLNTDWWRSKIGVVMQDGFIFYDTIANNIAAYDENLNIERLIFSAKVANIHDYIESLPLGYNTRIGNDGINLSQGQKQRILIARSVYKNPDYFFFDEATNALDANNEREIIQNLNQIFKNKTVVIIAHRLSTVKNADQIVVINEGKIVEQGTHEQLINKKQYYYQLIKNQLELGND